MEKIIITKHMVGIYGMQVCAVKNSADKEILAICNSGNPAGTTGGWQRVVRTLKKDEPVNILPVRCEKYPSRQHFLVYC